MKKRITIGTLVVMSLILFSCTGIQNLDKKSVRGRNVEYALVQNGHPTVVFETGMGQSISTWSSILDSVSTFTSTFVYNRPGYGTSSYAGSPRTAVEVAKHLNENLIATGQKPPYILVGHSLGGVFINIYARLYPENVAGVIFIDSSHPDQFDYFRTHQPLLYKLLMKSASKGKRAYEASILRSLQKDFRNVASFPDVPLTVLTAGNKSSFMESEEMRTQMLVFQSELASLSPTSKHIIVEGSGHFIHKNKPELLIQEIRNMRVRKQLQNN